MIKKIWKKCGKRCDNRVDRISQLPNDVIVRILSLLPLKEAVSTTVLSTRWPSDLWRYTPNLNFHDINIVDNAGFIECVNSVLELHKSRYLKEFSIKFKPNKSTPFHFAKVTKWLEFAFSRGVEVLELDIEYSTDSVVLNVNIHYINVLKHALGPATKLKSLSLGNLSVSGRALGWFLHDNCPLLERLIMKKVVLMSDFVVRCLALKHLDMQHCTSTRRTSIRVCAPNLTSLAMNDTSIMIEFVECALNIVQLKIICETGYLRKGFFPDEMHTLKKLSLHYHGRNPRNTVANLIRAAPFLDEFELFCTRDKRDERSIFLFPIKELMNGASDRKNMVRHILQNCALRKIVIGPAQFGKSWLSRAQWKSVKSQLQPKLPSHVQLLIE